MMVGVYGVYYSPKLNSLVLGCLINLSYILMIYITVYVYTINICIYIYYMYHTHIKIPYIYMYNIYINGSRSVALGKDFVLGEALPSKIRIRQQKVCLAAAMQIS